MFHVPWIPRFLLLKNSAYQEFREAHFMYIPCSVNSAFLTSKEFRIPRIPQVTLHIHSEFHKFRGIPWIPRNSVNSVSPMKSRCNSETSSMFNHISILLILVNTYHSYIYKLCINSEINKLHSLCHWFINTYSIIILYSVFIFSTFYVVLSLFLVQIPCSAIFRNLLWDWFRVPQYSTICCLFGSMFRNIPRFVVCSVLCSAIFRGTKKLGILEEEKFQNLNSILFCESKIKFRFHEIPRRNTDGMRKVRNKIKMCNL